MGCAVKTRVIPNSLQATSASASHLKLSVIADVALSLTNRLFFITVGTRLYTSTADSLLQPVNFLPCGLIALHTPYNGNSYQVRAPRRNAMYKRKMWKSDMRPW
jgi:hypothetical protein